MWTRANRGKARGRVARARRRKSVAGASASNVEGSCGDSFRPGKTGERIVQHESICPLVVSSDFEQLRYTALLSHSFDVHDEMNSERNRFPNARVRQSHIRHQDAMRKPSERLFGRIPVNRAEASKVAGVERLQQVERLRASHFAEQDSIGTMTEGRANKFGDRHRR